MKKLTKRIWAVALAVVMIMAMTVTAMAAGTSTGTITIEGAIKGATYTAYKIFDATYSGENNVNYTIPTGSKIETITGFSDIFDTSENGGETYVSIKSEVAESTLIDWLKKNENDILANSISEAALTNDSGAATVKLYTGKAGYYYIQSTSGDTTAASIDTAHPGITVYSKISDKPNIESKTVNKKIANTMQVGETATFEFTFSASNYSVDNSGNATQITSYTITDTLNGFSVSNDQLAALTVTVGGATVSSTQSNSTPYFTVTSINDGLKVVISNYDKGNYTSPSTVVVSYNATLTNANIANASTNTSELSWSDQSDGSGATSVDSKTATTYNYKVVIDNCDKNNQTTKLSGATFILTRQGDKNTEYYKCDNNGVVSWVTNQAEATEVTTDANGAATFSGLKAGTYSLVETKPADGYNLLANLDPVTLSDITSEPTATTSLTQTVKVENTGGSLLPSTGGMGTTMFYVIGAILVLGAGVMLVTRKRMSEK